MKETVVGPIKVTREDVRRACGALANKVTDADLDLLTRNLATYREERFVLDLQDVITLDRYDLELTRKGD